MENKFIEQKVSRECIEYAIENFSASEATNRIGDYIKGIINIDKMQYETALEIARLEKEASGLCHSVSNSDLISKRIRRMSIMTPYTSTEIREFMSISGCNISETEKVIESINSCGISNIQDVIKLVEMGYFHYC